MKARGYLSQVSRFFLYCSLAALGSFGLQRFCYHRTDGFALHKILSSLAPHPEWTLPPLSPQEEEEIQRLLDQPFHYLGKGAQAYVFASQDNQVVIKFCRFDHLRPPLWLSMKSVPLPLYKRARAERLEQRRGRLEKEFGSYKIAYTELKEQTGLLYLHLNKTSHLNKRLVIQDKGKVFHILDLDQMEFIVQRKATAFYPTLSSLLEQHKESSIHTALDHLVQLLASRYAKGICDKDPDLTTNFGFLGETPIQIDIGRFWYRETPPTQEEIREEVWRIARPLYDWLEERDASLASSLSEFIAHVSPCAQS